MARKHRIEYPGACYHVINRGNYRSWVFEDEGAKDAFEQCLAEAAVRSGWRVHAWVVMGNHFHLAVETPQANLSAGIQWLQVTFSARFNRYRREQGRLFQGRFKGILVETGDSLGQVCHYIELNPVRAGILPAAQLPEYRFGSFMRLWEPKRRPDWYVATSGLSAAGGLADTPRGRAKYRDYLEWLGREIEQGREQAYLNLSKGWAIGSEGFMAEVSATYEKVDEQTWDGTSKRQWRERQWDRYLAKLLAGMRARHRKDERPSARWKAQLALKMKVATDASNGWLAEKLRMSSPTFVSKQVGLARQWEKVKGKK